MALIPTSAVPNQNIARSSRMLTESNGILPLEDTIATITTDPRWKTTIAQGSNTVSVNDDGHLSTYSPSEIITESSTSTPLSGGAVFTGTSKDILEFASVQINIYADVASATDGLSIQFSSDGTNWDHTDVYTVPASTGKVYSFQPAAQYMRVVYTNGVAAQSEFRLQVIGTHTNIKPSSHRISDPIIDEDDAELVTTVLKAKFDKDGYGNITATASGNLKVASVEDGFNIAQGNVENTTFIHKFGNAPSFATADTATIWDGADSANINQMVYQYSSTADIDSISSSNTGDTQDIQIQGLDSNYNILIQTVTLQGQTRVAIPKPFLRVYRMSNEGTTDLAGFVYCYVNSAISSGTPTDSTKVRAVIQNGNNQTLMAVYTIPNGKTGYLRSFYSSISGANKSSNYIVKLKARKVGGVFQLKHISAVSDSGTSTHNQPYIEPEVFAAKTDIEMTAKPTAAGITAAAFSAGFDIVLVDSATEATASSSSSSSSLSSSSSSSSVSSSSSSSSSAGP